MNSVSERLNEHNVFDFAQRELGGQAVHLDLSKVQPDRVAASILTGALLTSVANGVLQLTLPASDRKDAIARNGLLFAVANRKGRVELQPDDPRFSQWLDQWRRPWTRGTREPFLRLGREEATLVEPSVFGKDYAAFINPHRTGGVAGANSGVAEVVRPWLHRFLPRLTTAQERTASGPEFVKGIGRLIDELVENVSEHAAGGRSLDVQSLVLTSLARGNNENARHRLHISVIDTGPGIVETACRKIRVAGAAPSGWSSADKRMLLRNLFEGQVPHLGRARGFGLPAVWDTVRCWDGANLVAVTNGLLVRSERASLEVRDVAQIVNGTIVSATFPIPPKTRQSVS